MSGKRKQKRLSHEEVRRQTCFVCRWKAISHPIGDEDKKLVATYICQGVPWDDPCIPCGLCRTCQGQLHRRAKWTGKDGERKPEFPPVADFREVVVIPPQTRAAASTHCECLLCQVHYPGGIGKVSRLSVPKVHDKGGRPKKHRTEEERLDASIQCTPPQPETMCPTCKLVGAQERDGHACNLAALTRNTLALVEENPIVKERVVANILKSLPKSPGALFA